MRPLILVPLYECLLAHFALIHHSDRRDVFFDSPVRPVWLLIDNKTLTSTLRRKCKYHLWPWVLGIIDILICASKWWGKTVFSPLLRMVIVHSINEFDGMHQMCRLHYPRKQTEEGKSQEWLLCIKGIFTFRPGAELPRAKMSRSEGAELENHTFRWFFADLMLRFTLPFTPGESQSSLHHYTSISSPFIISHRRRSHEREKKKLNV